MLILNVKISGNAYVKSVQRKGYTMRRSDREITDYNEMLEVIRRCDVCRLVLNDEEYPYIVPLNFGMEIEDDKVVFYFHGALEGKKYDLMRKNNKAAFEMDCGHTLFTDEEKGNCSMAYESIIGRGTVEILEDEKKYDGLMVLMKHYHKEDFKFNKAVIPMTNVFKLTVDSMTGKRRKLK